MVEAKIRRLLGSLNVCLIPKCLARLGEGRDHESIPVGEHLVVKLGMDPLFAVLKKYGLYLGNPVKEFVCRELVI